MVYLTAYVLCHNLWGHVIGVTSADSRGRKWERVEVKFSMFGDTDDEADAVAVRHFISKEKKLDCSGHRSPLLWRLSEDDFNEIWKKEPSALKLLSPEEYFVKKQELEESIHGR